VLISELEIIRLGDLFSCPYFFEQLNKSLPTEWPFDAWSEPFHEEGFSRSCNARLIGQGVNQFLKHCFSAWRTGGRG
jgi:hypothetical protein